MTMGSNKGAEDIERAESKSYAWKDSELPSKEQELIGIEKIALDWINFRYGGMWGRQ